MEELKINAIWTNDCQGKKDFDGRILSISTRYWPSNYQANGKYSANSSININYKDKNEKDEDYDEFGDYQELISKEFEGTQEEVFKEVENWAQERMNEITKLLTDFYKDKNV